jgi:hypothetical protein
LRFSQAKQRSTTYRRGWTSNPTWFGILRTISMAMQVALATRLGAVGEGTAAAGTGGSTHKETEPAS